VLEIELLIEDASGDVDEKALLHAAGATFERLGVKAGHAAIEIVGEGRIHELNREHRGKDKPTDVLSFPVDGEQVAVTGPPPERIAGALEYGDVVICPEVAATDAPTHAGTYEDEMALLVVHGLLHLLGMDHALSGDRVEMQARERELLDLYHGPLARDPWAD